MPPVVYSRNGLLRHLKIREAIVAFKTQKEVWFLEYRNQGFSVIVTYPGQ